MAKKATSGVADWVALSDTDNSATLWKAFTIGQASVAPLTSATQDYSTLVAAVVTTTGDTKTKARLNCLLRHWYLFKTMLACAKSGLSNLMYVDSGCLAVDVTANRYGCLCRRRARYLIVTSLPAPTVAGTDLAEIVVDTLKGEDDVDPLNETEREIMKMEMYREP